MSDPKFSEKDMLKERFSRLYDQYFPKIYAFIYYRTFHKETAEDLASQIFFKALEKINQFQETKGSFSTWLYTIARNTLTDHYRTSHPTLNIEDVFGVSTGEDIIHDAEVRGQLSQVREYLAGIKKEHRQIVIMRLWDDLTFGEIAEITGKTEGACKMTFSRAVKSLRQEVLISFVIILTNLIKP